MSEYERNTVFRSSLTGRFYFVPKARILNGNVRCVVGKKHDITEQLQPFLLKRFREKAKP